MNIMSKNSPSYRIRRNLASHYILSDFVGLTLCAINCNNGHVLAFVDVFANVFYTLDRLARFHIFVHVEDLSKKRVIRNYPIVVNVESLSIPFDIN